MCMVKRKREGTFVVSQPSKRIKVVRHEPPPFRHNPYTLIEKKDLLCKTTKYGKTRTFINRRKISKMFLVI